MKKQINLPQIIRCTKKCHFFTEKAPNLPCFLDRTIVLLYLVLIFCLNAHASRAQAGRGPWSNPLLIYGSSFGNVFQQLYLTQDYKMMLQLTAIESRRAHGDSVILKYYEQMQFAYPIRLVSHSRNGKNYQLIYMTSIDATVVRLKVDIVIENDTTRVVLPLNLNETKFYPFGIFTTRP